VEWRKVNSLRAYVRGIAGYVQDLYLISRINFSNPHSYTKFLILNKVREQTGAKVLIEAGTFRGITTSRAAAVFDQVYSIELDPTLAAAAMRNLKHKTNVKIFEGDALQVIPELFEKEKLSDVLLFLDGHFSGGETACGDTPEPAPEELQRLKRYQKNIKAIVIDDLRSFGTESGFPKKSELLRSAEDSFGSGYDIRVFLDQVIITKRAD